MTRPRLGVRITLLRSKQTKTLSTGFDGRGHVEATRIEWGIGKGQWKRDVRNLPQTLHCRGGVRATYFVIGSRYKLRYDGPSAVVQHIYEII